MNLTRVAVVAWGLFVACSLSAQDRKFPPAAELPVQKELPDPLAFLDGRKVTTKEQWFQERRPELKALFQHYMYGFFPPAPARIESAVGGVDEKFLGGKATKREITISFGPPECPKVELLLIIPNKRSGPVPCILGINFYGNHAIVADPGVKLSTVWMPARVAGVKENKATEASRGAQAANWSIDMILDRGYALATFYHGDLDPDRNDFTDGVHPHFLKPGQKELGSHDWGAIAAWAWGFHRSVDYLVTDKDVDAKRIAVFGHSRNGKTALLAAAFDERIAMAFPHQAGCGGTAPSRSKNPKAESVKRINTSFPHWFCDEFVKFNDDVERLPFDQNGLLALCAPRPVLYTNAEEDQWANPGGQFEMMQSADKVYRLAGAGGLDATEMPPHGKLVDSALGYFIRAGKHTTTPEDWKVILDFADKHFGRSR